MLATCATRAPLSRAEESLTEAELLAMADALLGAAGDTELLDTTTELAETETEESLADGHAETELAAAIEAEEMLATARRYSAGLALGHGLSLNTAAITPPTKHRGVRCPGCRDHPLPECAACGAPTAVVLPSQGQKHAITLCVACYHTFRAARAECRRETQAEVRVHAQARARATTTRSPQRKTETELTPSRRRITAEAEAVPVALPFPLGEVA